MEKILFEMFSFLEYKMNWMVRRLIALMIFTFVGMAPITSVGQEKKGKNVKPPANIISMDVLEVKGRIPKPQWFMILSRGDLLYKEIEETKDFLNEIEKSVRESPF